jgi:hypothetical protein
VATRVFASSSDAPAIVLSEALARASVSDLQTAFSKLNDDLLSAISFRADIELYERFETRQDQLSVSA